MVRIIVLPVLVCSFLALAPRAIGSAALQARSQEPSAPSDPRAVRTDVLDTNDWSSIRAAYEASRHAAVAVEGGYQARNPSQGWLTRFDGRGVRLLPDVGGFEWGLQLKRYGLAGDERVVSTPRSVSAQGQRVAYEWDASLEEWYVNDEKGLEHGFTVRERPTLSADRLTFELTVLGNLHPVVEADGRNVRFVDELGAMALTYSGLRVLDANGQDLVAGFELAGDDLVLSIDDRGSRYPLTIDPIAQQAYFKASNTGEDDRFGASIAISGNTVVVGASNEASNANGVNGDQSNNSASGAGAAYVFVRNGTSWSQQAYLKASDSETGDFFGSSISIEGDIIVIGAPQEDSSAVGTGGDEEDNTAPEAGAAYVFVREMGAWTQQAYLKASNTESEDFFGNAVSISGSTIVVGAWLENSAAVGVNGDQNDNSANSAGAAYVFAKDGTTWRQQAYLKASNTQDTDFFGFSVGISCDTIVIAALGEDSNAVGVNGDQGNNSLEHAGAAYVFVRVDDSWSQDAYLKASNTGLFDSFGAAVSVLGDTIVVGAKFEDSNATGINGNQFNNDAPSSGATYVFTRNANKWSQEAYLKTYNTQNGAQFGYALALSGDSLAVSALREDNAGAGYLFRRMDSNWSQIARLKASNPDVSDNFGWSVAIADNIVAVGAPLEDSGSTGLNGDGNDNSAASSGAAYAFDLMCTPSAVAFRNDATNPASYLAGQIAIGSTFTAIVDNNLASQLASMLFAFDTPCVLLLGEGQTLLCRDLGSGEIFTGVGMAPSSSSAGIDSYSVAVPNDPAICGIVLYSQAIQIGIPSFVLSNAQDLTVGG